MNKKTTSNRYNINIEKGNVFLLEKNKVENEIKDYKINLKEGDFVKYTDNLREDLNSINN